MDVAWRQTSYRIGRRYEEATLDSFCCYTDRHREVVARLRAFCERMRAAKCRREGLILYGPTGTGKDHLATACLRYAAQVCGLTTAWEDGNALWRRMRDRIGNDLEESKVVTELSAADVLLISDPLPQNRDDSLSKFEQSVLINIIDRRYRDEKVTWMTINVKDGLELQERLGAQTVDRIRECSLVVPTLGWASYRKPLLVVKAEES